MQQPDVYVVLGSNINAHQNMRRAVQLLNERCEVLIVSPVYRTPAMGYYQQDDFLNAVVKLHTSLSPAQFKQQVIGGIEQALQRVRDPENPAGPRTIDIDLILWGDGVFEYGHKPWKIPDEDILKFAYVVLPLSDIAPQLKHPETNQTIAEILSDLDQTGIDKTELNLNDM